MRLVLIDTFALLYRSYHALPKLTDPRQEPIGAVYGFTSLFMKILKEMRPDYVAAAFDLPEETLRHKVYAEYQAQRPEIPDDLAAQVPKIRKLLETFGVPIFSHPGYEADDLIGTLVDKLKDQPDLEIVILTGDLDTLQLVSPKVKVYTLKKGLSETVLYDEDAVRERFGFDSKFIPDFKGLKGDASDNIPGVAGIGEKTAKTLIAKFGHLEALYAALEEPQKLLDEKIISRRLIDVLKSNRQEALFFRDLATIKRDVPVEVSLAELKFTIIAPEKIRELFEEWGFRSFSGRLEELVHSLKLERRHTGSVASVKTPRITLLDSDQGWQALVKATQRGGPIVLGVSPREAKFSELPLEFGILAAGEAFVWQKTFPLTDSHKKIVAELPSAYSWDAKNVRHLLGNLGVETELPRLDVKIAAWLLEPDAKRYGLEDLTHIYLGREAGLPEGSDASELTATLIAIRDLAEILEERIGEQKLTAVWETIEKPLIRVLAEMETTGIRVVPEALGKLSAELARKLTELEKEIERLAGEKFNLASPKQLSRIIFDKLNLPSQGIRRTPSGIYSTDSGELAKISQSHPIVPLIIEWRELSKILTTYVDVLPKLIDPRTGRIHTTFLETGTATGRLASENPNLQNIPKRGQFAAEIRRAFRPDEGWLFASFDYSQIELRIAAHLGRDEKMIRAFKEGTDIHALTASQVWDVPLEKVTPELRTQAKALNFGIIYGMGWKSFAEATGLPPEESKKFIAEYLADFAGISRYIEEAKNFARAHGYAETLTGRRRNLTGLFSSDRAAYAQAERIAVNMPVQGFAADLIKLAMIAVSDKIRQEKWSDEVRLLLQVHDELLFEIKRGKIKSVVPAIRALMENVYKLTVPIVVEAATGETWGDLKPWIN